MAKDATWYVGEEAEEVEEEISKEVVEEAVAHIKMELTYHMSPITLKMQIGPNSQTRQEKGKQRTQYEISSYIIKKRRANRSVSPKRTTRIKLYTR